MESQNKQENAPTNEAEVRLSAFSTVEKESRRLKEKIIKQAEVLAELYPFQKENIQKALEKALLRMKYITGMTVLAVASTSAFAEQNATNTEQVATEPSLSQSVSEDASVNKEAPISPTEVKKDGTQQLYDALVTCTQAEAATDCAVAIIDATLVIKQASLLNALSRLDKAKDTKEKIDAFENLVNQIPILGPNSVEALKNKIPLLDGFQLAPKENGEKSDAGQKLTKRIDIVSNGEKPLADRTEAALQIATETPVVGRVLAKINPLADVISGIYQIAKEVNMPNPDLYKITGLVGKIALNRITFGLGGIVEGLINKNTASIENRNTSDTINSQGGVVY